MAAESAPEENEKFELRETEEGDLGMYEYAEV